jgi:hypothetical protein
MKKIDEIISELCDEIDILTDNCEYWQSKYYKIKSKYDESVMTSIRQSQAIGLGMVAIATGDKELAKAVSEMK